MIERICETSVTYGVDVASKSAVAFKYRSYPTKSIMTRIPTVWHHCCRCGRMLPLCAAIPFENFKQIVDSKGMKNK